MAHSGAGPNGNFHGKGQVVGGGLDGDHAFGDCSSRRPRRATSRDPLPHARQPDLPKRAGVTTGYYMERPARAECISPRDRSPAGLADGLDGGHAPAGIDLHEGEPSAPPTRFTVFSLPVIAMKSSTSSTATAKLIPWAATVTRDAVSVCARTV